jgi:peptide/nickel transport system substrate-binding protein
MAALAHARCAWYGGAALAALLACAPAAEREALPAAAGPRSGGTAVIGTIADLGSVNDLLPGSTTITADILYRMLFLHLLEEQADYAEHPPTFAPQLAERYEWSPDHRTLTFHLRRDAVWSDGKPITAEDVRFTWEAQIHPEVGWDYAFGKESIRDVEVVDPYTARFHFTRAYYAQLLDANEGVILPKHVWGELPFSKWRESGDWFRAHLVVSGPFVLDSWRPQEAIVLRRNPRYFEEGRPRLDRVVFRIIPDRANQVAQLLAGTLDYVEQVPVDQVDRLAAAGRAQVLDYPSRNYSFICWNLKRPPFDDADVRRALALAIDRQALVDALWKGRARIATSPILSTVWAHNSALEPFAYDPEEARRLLAAAGFQDRDGDGVLERGGRKFSFELATNTGNETRADAVVMIQEQLRRIGVEARPRLLELNTFLAQNARHEFDAALLGLAIDTSLDISFTFHSDSIQNGYNYGSYSNSEVDRLLDEARLKIEPLEAKPLLDRVQEILHREQPYAFLWEQDKVDGASPRLRDIRPNALSSFFNIREWWVADQPNGE